VGYEIFRTVQTGPGDHPASCKMSIGSCPGIKRPGCGVDHPPTSDAEVKERARLYLYSSHMLSWLVAPSTRRLASVIAAFLRLSGRCGEHTALRSVSVTHIHTLQATRLTAISPLPLPFSEWTMKIAYHTK